MEYLTVRLLPDTLVSNTVHPREDSVIKTLSPRLVCIFIVSLLPSVSIYSSAVRAGHRVSDDVFRALFVSLIVGWALSIIGKMTT